MSTDRQFRTFQTVKRYEESLKRHAQYCRWTKVLTCPCVNSITNQPELNCPLCKGRGKIFRNPGPFQIEQEDNRCDYRGRIYPKYTPLVVGSASVWKEGGELVLFSPQPVDGTYIQLESPYLRNYQRLYVDYTYNPIVSVVSENSEVYGTNTLRVIAPRFVYRGKDFEGSIVAVTRVRNTTKAETYTVTLAQKEYIHLSSMGTWGVGDTLEVDYTYIQPFEFMINNISARRRYDSSYVIDQADATLVTPYWAIVAPNDLVTTMSAELPAFSIIDPTHSAGNDDISDYFDVSRITACIDAAGTEYVAGTNLELYGRNEVHWITAKPSVKYTIHFTYHPTFSALTTYDSARFSESKAFVNRVNVVLYDKVTKEVSY